MVRRCTSIFRVIAVNICTVLRGKTAVMIERIDTSLTKRKYVFGTYANSKDRDQLVMPCSLIATFVN